MLPKYKDEVKKNLKPGEEPPKLEVVIKHDHLKIGIKGTNPFIDVSRSISLLIH